MDREKPKKLQSVYMVTPFYPPAYSGAGRQCAILSGGLTKHEIAVRVLTSHGRTKGLSAPNSADGRVQVNRLGRGEFSKRWDVYVWSLLLVREMLRSSNRYDLVHFHGMNLWALLPLLVARAAGKGIVIKVTTLGEDDPIGLAQEHAGSIKARLFELSHAVVGNSPGIYQAFANSRVAHRVHMIPNGIDVGKFFPVDDEQRKRLRLRLELPQDCRIAVCVSAITPRKGLEFLVEVWQQLKAEAESPLLLILGADDILPSYIQQLREQVQSSGLEKCIHFLGFRSNVPEYLQAADIFVFASTGEGLPSAVIEAMSCGLPSVVRSIFNVTDAMMTDGGEGFVVHKRDRKGFARAVQRLLSDPSLAAQMGAAARKAAVGKFSQERMVKDYLALYHTVFEPSLSDCQARKTGWE